MLAEAIQVGVFRKLRPQTQVLRLEDEAGSRGVEEDLARVRAGDLEGERAVDVLKLESRVGRLVPRCFWAREDGLWDLVDIVGGILNLDV